MLHRPSSPVQVKPAVAPGRADGLPLLPPLIALAELVFAFALIYGIDWLSPQLGILDMQPHPFWIPVLMLGLQYGTVSGLVAAGAAIAATLLSGLAEAGIGENHFAYFLRVWGQPILWIAVALLVGQFRMRQIATKQELRLLSGTLARQRDDLARHASGLRARCDVLERELAARRDAPPHRGIARLRAIVRDGDARPADLDPLIEAAFPGARARLYELVDDVLVERRTRTSEDAREAPLQTIPRGHPLHIAVVSGGSARSVLEPDGERMLDGIGLAAVPVHAVGSSNVRGVLVLESASASALDADGLAALDVLARLCAARLLTASAGQPEHSAADAEAEAEATVHDMRSLQSARAADGGSATVEL